MIRSSLGAHFIFTSCLFLLTQLPVLSMDISSDNQLLVTASADKNVKLWGLDFGDCHKSLFAHTDSIMSVRFVQDTHYFFTCSKDHAVKYWDGDKFEQIMKMPSGHHGEVWAMCVGRWGNVVVTGGQDKSIRVWTKTDEQLFLEEERELEMEQAYERDLVDAHDKADRQRAIGQGDDEEAEDDGEETGVASRKTVETLKSGEKVMEALDLAEQEYIKWQTYEKV